MVLLKTCDWDAFESYARNCKVGFFMVSDDVKSMKRVRVQTGRLAFECHFDLAADDQRRMYEEILDFVKVQGFIEIEGSVMEEVFFA